MGDAVELPVLPTAEVSVHRFRQSWKGVAINSLLSNPAGEHKGALSMTQRLNFDFTAFYKVLSATVVARGHQLERR